MIGKILITLFSFLFFIYIFWFKLIRKNDTNYIVFLVVQAIGIFVNFIQIIFNVLNSAFWNIVIWTFSIIIPALIVALEYKKINISEMIQIFVGKIFKFLGNDKKAKEVLINLLNKYPDSYYGHKNLAQIYEHEGGMRKAIEEYVKTLELKRDDYKSYYKISILLKDLGRNKQAILMLNNLLKVKPDHYEACMMLGELLIDAGEYKKAISAINKSLKINEDKEELIYNLGIAYARTNEFNLAKSCFERVVSLNNSNYNAYYRLGQIALLYRDFNMAETYFLNSAFKEKEAKSFYELSKIYIIKNNKDKAALMIGKAIDLDSKYYKMAKDEPMFFSIRSFIKKPKENIEQKQDFQESKKEIMIEEYLNDTYNLTKVLNKQEENNKKYSWNKKSNK